MYIFEDSCLLVKIIAQSLQRGARNCGGAIGASSKVEYNSDVCRLTAKKFPAYHQADEEHDYQVEKPAA